MYQTEALEQAIRNGPEVAVFCMIEDCGGFIWHMNHDMAHGRIPERAHAGIDRELDEARADQRRLILEALPRFGIANPLDENGRGTDEYWRWYRWWSAWHKGISKEEWSEASAAIGFDMTPEQIARFRPAGDWNEEETP